MLLIDSDNQVVKQFVQIKTPVHVYYIKYDKLFLLNNVCAPITIWLSIRMVLNLKEAQ